MSNLQAADQVTSEKYSVRNVDGELLAPGTYFVIRATDIFATPGLWAYVQNLETVLELNAQVAFLTDVQAKGLRSLADQALQLARTWQQNGVGRIPD